MRVTRSSSRHALRRSLRYGVIDGALYSIMVGIGEPYIPLFVLAAGLGQVASGLVATVPVLLGAVLQLATPWGVRRVGRLRRWVVLLSTAQALALMPLAVMAIIGRASAVPVFAFATIYWAASMGCGAGWSTWIGMIVPRRIRARYFSFKSRLSHGASFAGLAAGGIILERFAGRDEHLGPFAVLFLIAAAGRVACSYYLHLQRDTGPVPSDHREVGAGDLVRRLHAGRDGRFILFMALMQAGVQIGQPFFPPFVRAQLGMSYGQILALTGAAFITKALMQPVWGAFAHRYGAARLLWIGGLGIVPHTALWLVSPSFAYLVMAQLAAGAMWSAYELAVLLLMFEHIREEERTSLWSIFNVLNSLGMVAGSLLGGAILEHDPGFEGYRVIFLLSAAARLATAFVLQRGGDSPHPERPPAVEVESIEPGTIDLPLPAELPSRAERRAT